MSNEPDSPDAPSPATPEGGGAEGAARPDEGATGDRLVGTLIKERWRVLEHMGAGSFGTVYKVRDEKGGWIEAMKILRVDRLAGAEAENMRKRFLLEAQIVKRLGQASPHIVGLATYEEDLEAGLIYFLMEHVDGRVLSRVLQEDGRFPAERVVRVGLQVCEALIAAHESSEPVIHRDLKLENLMLTTEHGEEMVKVLDFGIAKMKQQEVNSRLTPTGALGTPGYAAPEQIRAGPVDGRTDLFALGVILYALLTGRDPWLGRLAHEPTDQTYELMARTDRGEVHSFEDLEVEVPAGLAGVVYRLLQRDPEARFQSARDLRDALREVAATGGMATEVQTSTGPLTWGSRPTKRKGRPTGPITGNVASRRLAAVWFADLVGYSALSSTDEDLALQLLQIFNATAERVVSEGGGRVVKFIGDAVFVEFPGTQQAVRNALDFRAAFSEATHTVHPEARLRIGIHVGDVTAGGDGDLFGDGVNVASRIQNQAEPGQVVVSQDVWRQLKQRRGYAFVSLGERKLKNIAAPVWLFSVEENLDSSGTTTGHLTSPEPQPRKNPVAAMLRAGLTFLAASVVILLATDHIEDRVGLGEWVVPVAAVLLAIGLVVVLFTARAQARETWEREVDEPAPWELDVPDLIESVAKPEVPRLTWARALVGGAMAFALLFGAAWAWLAVTDKGPPAMTSAPGSPLPALAILPLSGGGNDQGKVLTELLALSLDGVAGQRVIHPQVVAAALSNVGGSDARALGRAVHARYAASGTVTSAGGDLSAEIALVDVESGASLGSVRASAPSDSLASLVGALAGDILSTEGVTKGAAASPRSLPVSPPALRAYAEGESALEQANWPAAIDAFQRAYAADSSFAPALARLTLARSWEVLPSTAQQSGVDRALAVASSLPDRQRLLIQGLSALDRGASDAIPLMQAMSSTYPDDPEGWFLLGEALLRTSSPGDGEAEAHEAFARAVELAPSFGPAYLRLIPDALARGDTARARTLLAGYRAAQPSSPLLVGLSEGMRPVGGGNADRGTTVAATPPSTPTPPRTSSGSGTSAERSRYAALVADVEHARADVPQDLSPALRGRLSYADSVWRSAQDAAGGQRYADAIAGLDTLAALYEDLARDDQTLRNVNTRMATLESLRTASRDPAMTQRGTRLEQDARQAVSEARYTDALSLVDQAAAAYRQGARAAATTTTPPPETPSQPATPPPAEIASQVLDRLKKAMEAESLDQVRAVWTSIGTDEAQGLGRLFDSVRDLAVQYDVESVEQRGDRVVVQVKTTYRFYAELARKNLTQETAQVFELGRTGSAWSIVSSRTSS